MFLFFERNTKVGPEGSERAKIRAHRQVAVYLWKMIEEPSDLHWMQHALRLARQAYRMGEVPVGAVVVHEHQIIARGHNRCEQLHDPTAHAEMEAITAATHHLNSKYLNECTLYVTLEPCVMCAGALFWSQIGRVVAGATDPKRGYTQVGALLHPRTAWEIGVHQEECGSLMSAFFQSLRHG